MSEFSLVTIEKKNKTDQVFHGDENSRMFNRIAHRYDLLNRLLSGRRDIYWRKKLVSALPNKKQLKLLDVATGTGDVMLATAKRYPALTAVGIDPASSMLSQGVEKIKRAGLSDRLTMIEGSAVALPFNDNSFDAITISFGIRNIDDVPKALSEMTRVVRPGGKVLVLEFSLPTNLLLKKIYLWYFRNMLPWLGGVISGDRSAYRHLNVSVEQFPYGKAFCDLMTSASLEHVTVEELTFGLASIYVGEKQSD